ncbi:MAG: hypothetical protein ACOYNY_12360 [Caldilineaceae bacterium]
MMQLVTIDQIDDGLRKLPPEKLVVVYDFVSYLLERTLEQELRDTPSEALQTMLASEAVLARDWNRPEEDLAWADL